MLRAKVLLAVIVFINYYMPIMAKNGQLPNTSTMEGIPIPARSSLVLVLFGVANKTTA